MIEVCNLTKTYEDPDGNLVAAVQDARLTCHAGEVYGLLGPNDGGQDHHPPLPGDDSHPDCRDGHHCGA